MHVKGIQENTHAWRFLVKWFAFWGSHFRNVHVQKKILHCILQYLLEKCGKSNLKSSLHECMWLMMVQNKLPLHWPQVFFSFSWYSLLFWLFPVILCCFNKGQQILNRSMPRQIIFWKQWKMLIGNFCMVRDYWKDRKFPLVVYTQQRALAINNKCMTLINITFRNSNWETYYSSQKMIVTLFCGALNFSVFISDPLSKILKSNLSWLINISNYERSLNIKFNLLTRFCLELIIDKWN